MNAKVCRCESASDQPPSGLLRWAAALMLVAELGACNALDAPGPKDSLVVIPTDTREALLAAEPPIPISGGTLGVSPDGRFAVAADPDRDRVSVVELDTSDVQHIALKTGAEPGRVAFDDVGHAFVALRRSGELAVLDIERRSLEQLLHICAAPRGLAFDVKRRMLHVACNEGRLVSLELRPAQPAQRADLAVTRDLQLDADLRDVLVRADELWVSTFKRAELLRVGTDGRVAQRAAAQPFVHDSRSRPRSAAAPVDAVDAMQPHLAYRSLLDASGGLLMLHQGASTSEIPIAPQPQGSPAASPYSSATGGCSGIIGPAITQLGPGGGVRTFPVTSGLLSVDMALSPDGRKLAVVQAGARDLGAPQRTVFVDSDDRAPTAVPAQAPRSSSDLDLLAETQGVVTQLTVFDPAGTGTACRTGLALSVPGQSTAVAFQPGQAPGQAEGFWVVQSREPALLTIVPSSGAIGSSGGFGSPIGADSRQGARVIRLAGPSVRDTGHDLFHQDAGAGVACASCHPEGAEDGHVWHFDTLGARRTQALHVGLQGTAPFHWSGDQADIDQLMADVFVGRMGGVYQSEERRSALTRFLFALQPPAAPADSDAAAVERGRQLFASPAVGCGNCHSGDKLTNNQSVDVGTGERLQVPSLRAIAYRAPFMHDGCAATLRDRFEPRCGGAAHGNTSDLDAQSIDDLVAYLRTL